MTTTTQAPPRRTATRSRRIGTTEYGVREIVYRLLWIFVATLPGQGIVKVGGESTIAKAVGVVVTTVAVLSLMKSGRRVRFNDFIVLVLVFAGWVLVSTYWSMTLPYTWQRAFTMVQLIVMVLLLWEFAHTRRQVLGLMTAWIVGCVVLAGVIVSAWAGGEGQARYTAPGTHPGDQAYALLLAIPMAWYLSLRTERFWAMVAYRLFIPVALLAVVLTASRAALLSAGLALLIIPLTSRWTSVQLRVAVGAAVLAGVVAGAVLATSASGPIQRLSTTSTEISSGTLDHRTQLWAIGLRLIGAHPLLGVGSGGSKAAVGLQYSEDKSLHDTFLSVGVELGLVGLSLYLLILFAASYRTLSRLTLLEQRLAWVLMTVFVVSLVPRADDYDKGTWAILTLIALLGSVFRPRRKARDPVPTAAPAG